MGANKSIYSLCFPQDAIFIEQSDELQHGSDHNASLCPENQAGAGLGDSRLDTYITQWRTGKEGEMNWCPYCRHFSPNLMPLLYYVLRYVEQPIWLPLGCLF